MFIMDNIWGHLVCFVYVVSWDAEKDMRDAHPQKIVTLSKIYCRYSERAEKMKIFCRVNPHIRQDSIYARWEMRESVYCAAE
jgi:hypothetical protein